MKKLLFALIAISLLVSGVSFAGNVETIRGLVYLPAAQTTTGLNTAETTVWTDSTYLGPYINREFTFKNKGGSSETICLHGSINGTDWVSIETSVAVAYGQIKKLEILSNPMPYWKATAWGGAGAATIEARSVQSTN